MEKKTGHKHPHQSSMEAFVSLQTCLYHVSYHHLMPAKALSTIYFPLSTLWEPAYEYIVLRFRPKTSSCQLPYQRHSSSADCSRELFKGSNGSASLLVCTRKKIFWLGDADFLWVMS